jgi:hypothetical protein
MEQAAKEGQGGQYAAEKKGKTFFKPLRSFIQSIVQEVQILKRQMMMFLKEFLALCMHDTLNSYLM